MTKKRFTFADAKKRIETLEQAKRELEDELVDAYERVTTKKDFYQGLAWGAFITAVAAILIVVLT